MTAQAIPARLAERIASAAFEGGLSVAYSGGLDSRFLAFVARQLGWTVRLFHVTGPHIAPDETAQALDRARQMHLAFTCIEVDPTTLAGLGSAGTSRCYVCKKGLFSEILRHVPGGILCDGTNASDTSGYRPGSRALAELGIRSPLLEAGITKARIREIAAAIGLPDPGQAAKPCLLTRFPYGAVPSRETLALVARAEKALGEEFPLLPMRLRFPQHGAPVLHVARGSIQGEERSLDAAVRRLSQAEMGLKNLRWEAQETLSGFYDRELGLARK